MPEGMDAKAFVASVFDLPGLSEQTERALEDLDPDELLVLAHGVWREQLARGRDVDSTALRIIVLLGAKGATWAREMFDRLVDAPDQHRPLLEAIAHSLPPDEAFELARTLIVRAPDRGAQTERMMTVFDVIVHPGVLDLIDELCPDGTEGEKLSNEICVRCARHRIPWSRLARWIERGRPLALIALSALELHVRKGAPRTWSRPTPEALTNVLNDYRRRDPAPRVERAVESILSGLDKLTA